MPYHEYDPNLPSGEEYVVDEAPALSPTDQANAQSFLSSLEEVNLEDMTIATVRVGIHDVKLVHEPGSERVLRRVANPRVAEITNFVPMRVFNRMLASRNRVMKERSKYLAEKKEDDADPMVQWMLEQVLEVWKLTPGEEDMTLERLENGLDFVKVYKLFTVFFDKMMKQVGGKQPQQSLNHR